jgi:hypothetical protein
MFDIIKRVQEQIKRMPTSHGPSFDVPFSPLSLVEIERSEKAIGHSLPPLLKLLYLEVGNGGFGPGFGLLPLAPSGELKEGRFVIDIYFQYQRLKNWSDTVLPCTSWGCGILSCLDLESGNDPQVYRFEPNLPAALTASYLHGFPYKGDGLIPEKRMFSEWLGEWLDGFADEMFDRLNKI